MTALSFLGTPLPDEWDTVRLADVTSKVGSGATPRGGSSVYVAQGTAFIRSQNVHDHEFRADGLAFIDDRAADQLRNVTLQPNDVLLNITGDSILRTCLVPDDVLPARVNQHVSIVRANSRANALFLQKWLSLPAMKEHMLGHSSGGTRKAITKGHILSFPMPLPPLPEQEGIATTLGALDNRMASNGRAISLSFRLLDAYAAEVAHIAQSAVSLGDVATVTRETANPARLGTTMVDHFSIPAFDERGWPERVAAASIMSNKLLIRGPSILLSRLNPRIDRVWWCAPEQGVPALASTEFLAVSADDPLDLAALWLALRGENFRAELASRVTGTSGSHQRVRPDDTLAIEVPDVRDVEPAVKQRAHDLLLLVQRRRQENARLDQLRQALMPELLSGRLRVREAAVEATP
jgi:type I restriction enzyme, S subunit